jgi:hypothetical protein
MSCHIQSTSKVYWTTFWQCVKKPTNHLFFYIIFFLGYIFLKNVDQKKKKSMNSLWRVSEPQTNNWFEKLITLFFRANWVIEGRNLIKNYCLWITMGTFNLSLLLLLFFFIKKKVYIFLKRVNGNWMHT